MQMHREHCLDEPVLVNCAQVSEGCKSSFKQDITVQSPDVMVSVWQSLAVSDLFTPSICCSSARAWHMRCMDMSSVSSSQFPARKTYYSSIICATYQDAVPEVFDQSCKAFYFLLTPANAIAHPCLFETCNFKHCVQSTIAIRYINSDAHEGTTFAEGTLSCAYSLAT